MIRSDAWQLDNFKRNATILWAHAYSQPPVGRATRVWVENRKLMVGVRFADAETYQFADTIFRLYLGGYLRAVSVGFLPHEWEKAQDQETRPYGLDFTRVELLEVSCVPVPANASALVAASAAGINTAPLKSWARGILADGSSPTRPTSRRRSGAARQPISVEDLALLADQAFVNVLRERGMRSGFSAMERQQLEAVAGDVLAAGVRRITGKLDG